MDTIDSFPAHALRVRLRLGAATAGVPHQPLFTEAERAALDYASELTAKEEIAPETFARLRKHYGEREICDIVWLVASEHLTNSGLNIGSDGLCNLRPGPKVRAAVARR